MSIHPAAVIDPTAELDSSVTVGPYAVIEAGVRIGADTRVEPHAVISGPTTIGERNFIGSFAVVGGAPQDLSYGGEPTELIIGSDNRIREFASIHRGTVGGNMKTMIGDHNLLMAYTHVAHDCQIGDHVIMANAASLGGHVTIGDWAILGGFSIVHQFCCVGAHCVTGMGSVIAKDVPPYITISGHPAKPHGINKDGLKRRGFSADEIREIVNAYKILYMSGLSFEEARKRLGEISEQQPAIELLSDFIENCTRSIVR